ncbi:MAG: purine-binding chemotaxis protein CheW [Methanomicrobium sp.]|nr:purine-binding chemotaxis protein CheW [Methanomicrobium sp.]MBO4522825.1 purine-binding chemotaxis protein CheW [Methanomicrobium sp.]MBR6011968.1 purine-binding chemotaxis protein CheW [Methanomicrobium sp.]MBR6447492.1 purine-binding chemotaxis protein CheW [Methanomicrobium sp.]
MIDIVQFEISGVNYALDIQMTREIVEMMPITPVPRAPEYIAGIINLRGEITNILSLNYLMGLPVEERDDKKIIVLAPDATEGSNVGLIVDDVHSVRRISEDSVDQIDNSLSREAYVKGVIKIGKEDGGKDENSGDYLIIWVDIAKILYDILVRGNNSNGAAKPAQSP